jgi:hypothetical protein
MGNVGFDVWRFVGRDAEVARVVGGQSRRAVLVGSGR